MTKHQIPRLVPESLLCSLKMVDLRALRWPTRSHVYSIASWGIGVNGPIAMLPKRIKLDLDKYLWRRKMVGILALRPLRLVRVQLIVECLHGLNGKLATPRRA